MMRFYESLTDEEMMLLEHMTMQYLDKELSERWSEHGDRVDHDVVIAGENIVIQGFSSPFFDIRSYALNDADLPFSVETISSLASLANHHPKKDRAIQEPSHGVVACNQRSGDIVLFDHPVDVQHAVSLDFSDARSSAGLGGDLQVGEEASIYGGKTTCIVEMAPEQFVRFVRGGHAATPCTISRRAGYMNDNPPVEHLNSVKRSNDVKSTANGAVKDLVALAEQAADLMGSGKMTSQKRFDELEGILDSIETAYKEAFAQVTDAQEGAVSSIQDNYRNRMVSQIEREVLALPEAKRNVVLGLMNEMGKDL